MNCIAELGVGGAHPGGLKLTKEVLKKEKIVASTKLLDAGCGTGQTAAYIANKYGCQVTALDYNTVVLEKAKARFRSMKLPVHVHAKRGNIEDLDFADNSFHIVLSESVLGFTDADKSISECSRILKEPGTLLAIEMVLEDSISDVDNLSEITHFYGIPHLKTTEEWINMYRNAGFKHIQVDKYKPNLESHNLENSPDFSLSDEIDDQLFDVLRKHHYYMKKYDNILGFRIFYCNK
ncbi:class I SAM-dependent methyltransferase [Oceanobacillus halophilus]|uniref:Class I SAM-dependent methyltransferase n=2 Tax=Oceanobacillus halophilus TaxID=930130 RepID=A0A494ZTZ0_9BACI|nr:class I SAM-dependent methyltransferase [Oceanobacillus halophilus]